MNKKQQKSSYDSAKDTRQANRTTQNTMSVCSHVVISENTSKCSNHLLTSDFALK